VLELLGTVAGETQAGKSVTGTLDLTKLKSMALFNPEGIAKMGQHGAAVPFTATLDPAGRLAKLVVELPAAGRYPADPWRFTFSGYGTQRAQSNPTGLITEA
jgi:hypothetical protein